MEILVIFFLGSEKKLKLCIEKLIVCIKNKYLLFPTFQYYFYFAILVSRCSKKTTLFGSCFCWNILFCDPHIAGLSKAFFVLNSLKLIVSFENYRPFFHKGRNQQLFSRRFMQLKSHRFCSGRRIRILGNCQKGQIFWLILNSVFHIITGLISSIKFSIHSFFYRRSSIEQ